MTVTVPPPIGSTVVGAVVQDTSGGGGSSVPVSFAQVFSQGHVPSGAFLAARVDGASIPLQVDTKATHTDGSLRHAVLSARIPSLGAGGQKTVELVTTTNAPAGGSVSAASLLATGFDAVVSLNVGGTVYQASARDMLQADSSRTWLSGPLVTEWTVSGPMRTSGGSAHPHLQARIDIRAYAGLDAVRVDVTVENTWALESSPSNFTYDATVTVAGKGTVLSQSNVTHYRQARWRRVFWWGNEPRVHVRHDRAYLEATRTVPTYDRSITISESTLASMESSWSQAGVSGLMAPGLLSTYMPGTGGRIDIAPLPRWSARYLMSQDRRAKVTMLGNSEQAGSFGIHYRDKNTGLPISIDTYPNATIMGSPFFPSCGGSCSTPYTPDMAHQPSTSYVPYLVTGDRFHLEELQFWANWNLFYWGNHGGSQGLLVYEQRRALAWALRTLGHAAFISPDSDPLKAYFNQKLANNLAWYNNASRDPTNSSPLGYVLDQPPVFSQDQFNTFMDDFLTWAVGHVAHLGYSDAATLMQFKAKFPVGRMIDPGYCWILASTSWTTARSGGVPYQTWDAYRIGVIESWSSAFKGTRMSGDQVQNLIDAPCNSPTMANILGLQIGEMIGWADCVECYPANLQAALAVSVEHNAPGSSTAWSVFMNRSVKPNYSTDPHWAIVPWTP